MFGAAGGAGLCSLEEEAAVTTSAVAVAVAVAAVAGSTVSEFEIILPSSHFSYLSLFFIFYFFSQTLLYLVIWGLIHWFLRFVVESV